MDACREYEGLISAFIDGALEDGDRAELMAHMAQCPDCQAYFDDQIAIHDVMAAMEARFRVPSGFTATLPEVSGTCLTQTMIFISICLLSYFTPMAREMTMRWTSEVPS